MRRPEIPDGSQFYDIETSEQNPKSAERLSLNSGGRVAHWSPSGSLQSFSSGSDPASCLISPSTMLGSERNSQYETKSQSGAKSTCSCKNYGRAHNKRSRRGQLASHTPYDRTCRHSIPQNDGWDGIGNEDCRYNTHLSRSNAGSDCKRSIHCKHYPWNGSVRSVQSNTPSQEGNSMTREHNQTGRRDFCQPQRTQASCSCGNQGQRNDPPPKSGEGCVVGRQMVEPCQCGERCSRRNSWCDFYNTSTDSSFPMTNSSYNRSPTSSYNSYLNHDSGTIQQNFGGNKSDARKKCDGMICPSCLEKYPQGCQKRPCERSRDTSVSENQSCYCSNTEGNKRYGALYTRQSQDNDNKNSQVSPQRKPYN